MTGSWQSQVAADRRRKGAESEPNIIPPKPAWYYEGLEDLDKNVEDFFGKYAKLGKADIARHIETLRERAYSIHAYPCIGAYRFLHNTVAENPLYGSAVTQMKSDPDARFLDIACCLGQEARQFAFDGVTSRQLLGTDIVPDFFDVGYDLFNDRDRFEGRFFPADMLDENSTELNQLKGSIDVVFVGAFLHLFPYETQLQVLVRTIGLLKSKPGVKVLGRQNGSRDPGTRSRKSNKDQLFFQHDVDSFKKQFEEAARLTGTRWEVGGEMLDWVEWRHGRDLGICGKEYNADTIDLRFWAERVE